MHALPRARSRSVALVFLVSAFAALFAMTVRSQGVTATAKPVVSSAPADVAAMKRRIDELERRVLELEKQKADQLQADKDDEAAAKKLEQRLAAVEKEQRDAAARDNGEGPAHSHDTQVMRAPFVVVDDDGKRLVTIDRGGSGKGARLIVGDPKGVSVNLGAASDSSYVQLIDARDAVTVGLESTLSHAGMVTFGKLGKTWIGWDGADLTPRVAVENKAGWAVVEMRTLPESQGGCSRLQTRLAPRWCRQV